VRHDLETFPWPWDDDSIDEIRANHIMEHLGQDSDTFLKIMQEIYRICKPGARIEINAPHPRHDDFISDPTHVRAITPRLFELFSKNNNERWAKGGFANSQLARYLDVDFEIKDVQFIIEPVWMNKLNSGKITRDQLNENMALFNNVIKETKTVLEVIK